MYKGSLENYRKIGYDYFKIKKYNNGNDYMEGYLKQFNLDDYYILKSTSNFRFVDANEFMNMIYAGYIFFKKDLYNKQHIQDWLDLIKEYNIDLKFLNKPFPPKYVYEKIKVIDNV